MRLRGRIVWKLLLALWVSMLLSILATGLYFHLTSPAPARPPPGVLSIGPLPVVPLVIGCIVMAIVGFGIAWYLSVPLRHLQRALHQVGHGRFDARVAPLLRGPRDEFNDVAEDFDRMAARLQQLTDSRQTLLHDISHELRSPLARLQVSIGLARQDPAQAATMLDRIERESDRIDALIEELLTLHRLEAAIDAWPPDRIDVMDLLHAVTEDAAFEARAMSRDVRIDAPGEFVAEVRGELLYRALENVIRNAVKYTAPDTTVDVHAAPDAAGDVLVVTVGDRGPGVPAAPRQAMFEPFVRLDGAASVRGVGLGLAIAHRAVALHGGTIEASDRDGGGLLMTLRLPRAAADVNRGSAGAAPAAAAPAKPA